MCYTFVLQGASLMDTFKAPPPDYELLTNERLKMSRLNDVSVAASVAYFVAWLALCIAIVALVRTF
jgi:hypothetical protein